MPSKFVFVDNANNEACWPQFKIDFADQTKFIAYFTKQWLPKKELWVKEFRMDATFNTNNYVESYHSKLKGRYLGKSRNLRIDRVVYILSQQMILDYRFDAMRVNYGCVSVALSDSEKKKMALANSIEESIAAEMVTDIDDDTFRCQSFTDPFRFYDVTLKDKYIKECNCPDGRNLCKHMFLVSRVKMIYYTRKDLPVVGSVGSRQHHDNINTSENQAVNDEIEQAFLLDAKERYQNMEKRFFDRSRAFCQRSSTPEQLEYGAKLLQQLMMQLDRAENPVLGPSKQR